MWTANSGLYYNNILLCRKTNRQRLLAPRRSSARVHRDGKASDSSCCGGDAAEGVMVRRLSGPYRHDGEGFRKLFRLIVSVARAGWRWRGGNRVSGDGSLAAAGERAASMLGAAPLPPSRMTVWRVNGGFGDNGGGGFGRVSFPAPHGQPFEGRNKKGKEYTTIRINYCKTLQIWNTLLR